MRDLSELKMNERGKPVKRSPPTLEAIDAFQRHFNVALPAEYIYLLNFSNGGHPELDSIEPIGRAGAARRSVDHFYYLDGDTNSIASLWTAMRTWISVLGENYVPFAVDGGGNPFVLDLNSTPPKVKACLHDENYVLIDLAPSFTSFIDALSIDPEII
jgi:hypothetical protein